MARTGAEISRSGASGALRPAVARKPGWLTSPGVGGYTVYGLRQGGLKPCPGQEADEHIESVAGDRDVEHHARDQMEDRQ